MGASPIVGSNPTLSVGSNEVEMATFPWDENFHDNFFELGALAESDAGYLAGALDASARLALALAV
jgi:hypothetical protein